jgi:hypothetical protein
LGPRGWSRGIGRARPVAVLSRRPRGRSEPVRLNRRRPPDRHALTADDAVMQMLMKEVRDRRLGEWIGPDDFSISTTSTSRQCHLYYEQEVEVLPGWKKLLTFEFTADQPLI